MPLPDAHFDSLRRLGVTARGKVFGGAGSRTLWLRRLLATATVLLMRWLSPKRHAVVHGVPDQEGNSIEVVRYLLQHYAGEVYWLVASGGEDARWLLADCDLDRLHPVRKASLRAFYRYVTAELVFFTHGLYGSPPPPPNRTIVNLWHGDGPKRTANLTFHANLSSTYLVAGTSQFGLSKAEGLGMPASRLLVTGNPRVDQMRRPVDDAKLRALGFDPHVPTIIWAPTYRASRGGGGPAWADSDRLGTRVDFLDDLLAANSLVRRRGGQLMVKPHMLDVDEYVAGGLSVVSDRALALAEVPFYSLLGRATCLITDYSSIWTDFLTVDRPIGYFCPDLVEYQRGRGFNVDDFGTHLAGPLMTDRVALLRFLAAVLEGRDPEGHRRQEVAATIGAVVQPGATARLMTALQHPALRPNRASA